MDSSINIGERLARAVFRAARGVAQAGIGSRPGMTFARMFGVRKATIFMLHRFTEGGGEDLGTDVVMLRNMLGMLRKQGVQFMRLRDLAAHVEARTDLTRPTAVFTVDDGYQDFKQLAAPIFAGFDCSPTVFLVTEFVSGREWCWWDRVMESFLKSPLQAITLDCDQRRFSFVLGSQPERRREATRFVEELKWMQDHERLRMVAEIGTLMQVDLPALPTADYAPLSWDDPRECRTVAERDPALLGGRAP
jgi:hypothetical protein